MSALRDVKHLVPAGDGRTPLRVFWFLFGALCATPMIVALSVHTLRADAIAEATLRLELDWRDAIAVCANAGGVVALDPHTVRPTCLGGSFRRKPRELQ